ncbi:LamG domain-containing protein [Planctomycetota bacterium]
MVEPPIVDPPQAEAALIAGWTFDEGKGDTVTDSSGNGFSGIIMGNPSWVPGVRGTALDFDGEGDYVTCSDDPQFQTPQAFSVSVWVNIRAVHGNWAAIVTKGDNSWRLALSGSSTRADFAWGTGAEGWPAAVSNTEMALGEWYHLCGTFAAGDGGRIYVNGIEDNYRAYDNAMTVGDYPVMIGENAQATGRFFDGSIDEVWLYRKALTASEVLSLSREN